MLRLMELATRLYQISLDFPEITSDFEDLFTNTAKKILETNEKNLQVLQFELDLALGLNSQLCRGTDGEHGVCHKIQAIKLYRERTGLSLREAKYAIDHAIDIGHCNFDARKYLRDMGMTV